MVQFAETFPDAEIVATLSRQLSWSHFRELLPLRQPFQREFYAERPDKIIEREIATFETRRNSCAIAR